MLRGSIGLCGWRSDWPGANPTNIIALEERGPGLSTKKPQSHRLYPFRGWCCRTAPGDAESDGLGQARHHHSTQFLPLLLPVAGNTLGVRTHTQSPKVALRYMGGVMFDKAKEIFDDAMKYINPETDPLHWDLLSGLSELAMSLRALEEKIERIEQHLKHQH
jgi:hypothetical protein